MAVLEFEPVLSGEGMYKGTRHTGKTWGYKASSVGSSALSSDAECRAIVSKCKETFIALRLLVAADFEKLDSKEMRLAPTKAVGRRMGRGRERLEQLGIPKNLIFAAPAYLLIAPRIGGLLSRLSRLKTEHLPPELRELHAHLQMHPPVRQSGPWPSQQGPTARTLYHVAKDGTRTAFTPKALPERLASRTQHATTATDPSRAEKKTESQRPAPVAARTTLSLAFQDATKKAVAKKS
jgi:hypothetical protein